MGLLRQSFFGDLSFLSSSNKSLISLANSSNPRSSASCLASSVDWMALSIMKSFCKRDRKETKF